MRTNSYRGAWLLAAWLALTPAAAWGQLGYAPADPQVPLPLGSTRPEDGGLYLWTEGVLYRQTNPLKAQTVAVRGFRVFDDSLPPFVAGDFVGSGVEALNVNQLTGQDGYQPGWTIGMGWKFRDGTSLSLNWLYLTGTQYRAAATLAPARAAVGQDLADSFLYADVYNIPPEFAGAENNVTTNVGPAPSPFLTFGIWNGASIMTQSFRQRFQQWELTYRMPIWDTDSYRFSALVGPKFAWFWEKYKWVTTSIGDDGAGNLISGPETVGIYTNIVSNRMYGVFVGCQQECYLGHGFAVMLDTRASLFLNSVKLRAKYETEAKYSGLPQNKTARREFTIVPELQANLGIMWYPTEFIQVFAGYDVMLFMNTLAGRHPIDFNYGSVNPDWAHYGRFLDGFRAGFSLAF